MKQKEITINGRQFPVAFTMKTMIGYEGIANNEFFGETFEKLSGKIALIMAAILAADENADITADELMNADNFETVKDVIEAYKVVMDLAAEFFERPEVEPKPEPAEEKGDDSKN